MTSKTLDWGRFINRINRISDSERQVLEIFFLLLRFTYGYRREYSSLAKHTQELINVNVNIFLVVYMQFSLKLFQTSN